MSQIPFSADVNVSFVFACVCKLFEILLIFLVQIGSFSQILDTYDIALDPFAWKLLSQIVFQPPKKKNHLRSSLESREREKDAREWGEASSVLVSFAWL